MGEFMDKLVNRIGRVVEPGKVDFLERDLKNPEGKEVLIRIVSSSICGSDLHIFKGKHPSAPLPVTIGHEFSGDIIAVGDQVKNVKAGDRVTVEPCLVCGECLACRTGNYGYCENISFTYRNGDGAMAEYITVQEPYVYKLPDSMSYDEGALIEPLSVATHAVRRADIKLGEKVIIIGSGAIGMLIAALSRRSGASEVVVVDHNDAKLQMSLEMGATRTINSKNEDIYQVVNELTDGHGMDKSFECVGLEATFLQAMMSIKKNGLATIIGIFENPNITIPATRFITHEIKVQGSQGYCWDFPVALSVADTIPLKKLITHKFPLDQLQEALETCLSREKGAIKVLIEP